MMSALAPTKLVPLSETMAFGLGLLARNLDNACKKLGTSKWYNISMCTARINVQVKSNIYRFSGERRCPCLVRNGPAQSIPHVLNTRGQSFGFGILKLGKGAIRWCCSLACTRLHMV